MKRLLALFLGLAVCENFALAAVDTRLGGADPKSDAGCYEANTVGGMTCFAQGVAITSGTVSGASDKVEDAAETAGGTGSWILGVRRDTQASSATTTGDNATLNLDATGNLWISGTVLEDVAEVAGGTGHAVLSVRRDRTENSINWGAKSDAGQ